MKAYPALVCILLLAPAAQAAQPQYLRVDYSVESLMDKTVASQLWKDNVPARLFKLYPPAQWGFATEVNGGFDEAHNCVVSARAMMLPRRGKQLVFDPKKIAVTFATTPGSTPEQCKELARDKLREAIQSIIDTLAPPH